MRVISCVKYVGSGASCLLLCFPTPAVQISITNISPWVTLSFLSVKRSWLVCIHVQIGPKSFTLDNAKSMFLCLCTGKNREGEKSQLMHECVRTILHALVIQQVLSRCSAGRHSPLQKETTSIQELHKFFSLLFFLLLSASSLVQSWVRWRKQSQITTGSCRVNIYCLWYALHSFNILKTGKRGT